MNITSQISILILKSLTSDPDENVKGFFFQVTLNCIIEWSLLEVAIEMEKERKIIKKKEDRCHQGLKRSQNPVPYPVEQDEVTSVLRRFRQLREMHKKTSENP